MKEEKTNLPTSPPSALTFSTSPQKAFISFPTSFTFPGTIFSESTNRVRIVRIYSSYVRKQNRAG
jgi:hypothetical protein